MRIWEIEGLQKLSRQAIVAQVLSNTNKLPADLPYTYMHPKRLMPWQQGLWPVVEGQEALVPYFFMKYNIQQPKSFSGQELRL